MYNNNFNTPFGYNQFMTPFNYNNMPQQPPPVQIPNQPQTQNLNSNAINTNKIFVNGIEDAKSRMLLPNSDFMFLDNDKKLIYQRVVDGTGQSTIKTYRYSEINENEINPATPQFALKSELDKSIKELNDKINNLIEQQKSNIELEEIKAEVD